MRFELKAMRGAEGVVAFALDAPDESEALRQARSQGYTVLSVRARQSARQWLSLGPGRGRFPLVLFSQELLALLEAGLTLVEAIETLAEKETRPEARQILNGVIAQLFEGQTFSRALQQFPDTFPPLYIATVRASEKTGDLSRSLGRYVSYTEQMDVVRAKVVSASIYPVLLLGVGGLVTLFLMGYVVPRFSRIYEDVGNNLPFLSRVLLEWGHLLQDHAPLVLGTAVVLAVAAAWVATRRATRQWITDRLWQIPAVGERMRIYQLARFYRTLGMLLQGGTPIVTALDMASDLLHAGLRHRLRQASTSVREGLPLSVSMERHGLTTPVSVRMLNVGERTGQMGDMMDRIAAFYDGEMARWVDWFTKIFEPMLMALIGVVIGGIVILMYLPIFELAGSIQ